MRTKKLPLLNGLCGEFGFEHKLLSLFEPTKYEEPHTNIRFGYWASDVPYPSNDRDRDFGPTRQTIVLLMHEMEVNPIEVEE